MHQQSNGGSFNLLGGLFDGLRPIESITPSEWADKYRILSPKASSTPGRWETARTPYLREIMDRFSPYDPCEEVVVMKGAQIGMTEAGMNVMGYWIHIDPGSIFYIMPTVETVKRNSKIRIDPMIESTPELRKKIKVARSREAGNTMLQKEFPGGVVYLAGANSASSLASVPVGRIVLDEIDKYPVNVDKEGDPIKLAIVRTRTYPRRKIFMLSTPGEAETSRVAPAFEKTTQRKYHVPCPHCGYMQPLEFDWLRWEGDDPYTTQLLCQGCDGLIHEQNKHNMLAHGEWRDTMDKPGQGGDKRKIWGYHINSLYSPPGWFSWGDAVKEHLDAEQKGDAEKQVFQNSVLGLPWEASGVVPEWKDLYKRRGTVATNKPIRAVVFLTAGVDVQGDRLEVEIVGWCRGKISQSIDYRVIPGDPGKDEVWKELDKLMAEVWVREDGAELSITKLAIDSGYSTTQVYEWCKKWPTTRVFPVKGNDSQLTILSTGRPVHHKKKGQKAKAGGLMLYHVGVGIVKSEIYSFVPLVPNAEGELPNGYCMWPAYGQEYFQGLCAEKRVAKVDTKNFTSWVWVKTYERNEPLDTRVYARAAANAVGMDKWVDRSWDIIDSSLTTRAPQGSNNAGDQRKKSGNKRGDSFW